MTTTDHILAAILAEPSRTDLRLVMADVLEDEGQVERAEFIKIQCELAQPHGDCTCRLTADSRDTISNPECPLHRLTALRARERELVRECWRWWPEGNGFWQQVWRLHTEKPRILLGKEPPYLELEFRRGFIESVTLPLRLWTGGECACDNGWTRFIGEAYQLAPQTCPACSGSGRTPALGRELVAVAPLTSVLASDKRPRLFQERRWLWHNGDHVLTAGDNYSDYLPDFIFKLLEGGDPVPTLAMRYDTEAAAQKALSVALLAWARQPVERRQ